MFGVECFDTHDEPISHYTQWDINQTLKIVLYGMDDGYMKNAPYVHFANIKSSEALVVRSTLQGDDTVLVDIPNQLLEEPYPLLVYVYLNDSGDASSQRTIVKIEIPVQKRAKPSDYEYVENIDRVTAEVIKQEIYDDFMDEVNSGNLAYPYVTFIDESTGKHVNLKVSDEKFGLYVDSTNRQLLDTGDIVNNLMTNSSTKVLSASMGTTLKNMIDVIPDEIDEKIEEHDSSPTSHSDIRDNISSVSSAVDTMQDSITEIENKIDDIDFRLDDSISGNGVLTTTDALVDSSPIEMRIKGNTRQNLWVNPIATKNGITISNAADGAITISGSATATTTVTTDKIYTMKAGVTYSIGADKLTPVNGFVFSVYQYNSEDRLLAGSDSITYASKGRTITTNAQMAYVKFVVVIPSGVSVSETYHIMLNVGEELEPWCAPGLNSIDEISIVTTGKNLINTNGASALRGNFGIKLPNLTLQPGSYVVKSPSGLTGVLAIYRDGDTSSAITSITESGRSFTITSPLHGLDFRSSEANQITLDNISQFQLELGSTATDYEPPQVTTTPIDLDGNSLRSLPDGTCDELVIEADGSARIERNLISEVISHDEFVEYTAETSDVISLYYAERTTAKVSYSSILCEQYKISNIATMLQEPNSIRLGNSGDRIYLALPKGSAPTVDVNVIYLSSTATDNLSKVQLPTLPADKSNIYTTSNVPTTGLTVRYWKKSGELVENLYDKLAQLQSTISSIQEAVTQP